MQTGFDEIMQRNKFSTTFGLVFILLASLMIPFMQLEQVSASSSSQHPTAYLPSWELDHTSISVVCSQGMRMGVLSEFENWIDCGDSIGYTSNSQKVYGTDDVGNHYYAFVGSSSYSAIGTYIDNDYGINIVKFDTNGTLVWAEKIISTSSTCSYDRSYCTVEGIHITGEDSFFLISSHYNTGTITYDANTSISITGHQFAVAYHSTAGWEWAETKATDGSYAHSSPLDARLDGSNNLIVTMDQGYSGNYDQYSITHYTTLGGKWVRQLELMQNSNAGEILIDIEQNETHYFILAYDSIRYDSQTVSCPAGSLGNYCHIWLTINSNGVKTSSTAVKYADVLMTTFEVVGNAVVLHGVSVGLQDNEATNFTGTPQSCNGPNFYCGALIQLDTTGTWSNFQELAANDDDDLLVHQRVHFNDNGSGFYSVILESSDNHFYDSQDLRLYENKALELTLVGFDSSFGYEWHQSFATNGFGGFYAKKTNAGYIIVSGSTGSSSNYWSINHSNQTMTRFTAWVSSTNGSIFDLEEGVFGLPMTTLANGGLLLNRYDSGNDIEFYMPDHDNDNFGLDDNCPDVYNPSQADHNGDSLGDACDDDDDSDTVLDGSDGCPLGEMGWISSTITDHDGDGCKDSTEEDGDDDNDGYSDQVDDCPLGVIGAENDYDADGCKNSEDNDDDNDGVNDGSDQCPMGTIDWLSGTVTDHDGDGCNDLDEDLDDDNDGVADAGDSCPKGEVGWPSNANTDFDGDGCKDGYEDEDDDGDGVANFEDQCEDSIGPVDLDGCSPSQFDNDDGTGNTNNTAIVYYVCPGGSMVVTDLSECPSDNSNNNTDGNQTQIYYVCPSGTSVVTDISECPDDGTNNGNQNITYILDPNSNLSDEFMICPGGTAIVMSADDCPGSESGNQANSPQAGETGASSQDDILLFFAGGAFLLAMGAIVIVLVRRPVIPPELMYRSIDSTEQMFKTQPELPTNISTNTPNSNLKGVFRDGYEWVEWPENSGKHWYRSEGSIDGWSEYQN